MTNYESWGLCYAMVTKSPGLGLWEDAYKRSLVPTKR